MGKIDPAVEKELKALRTDNKAFHRWIDVLGKDRGKNVASFKALEKKLDDRFSLLDKKFVDLINETRAWVEKLHK